MKKFLLTVAVAAMAIGMNAQGLTPEMKKAVNAKKFEKAISKEQFKKFNVDGKQMTIHEMTPAQKAKCFAPRKEEEMDPITYEEPHALVEVPSTATSSLFSLSGYFYNSWFGMLGDSNLAQTISVDGTDIYFSNLFPNLIAGNYPVKGSINMLNGTVSIPQQAFYGPYDYYGDGSEIDTLINCMVSLDEEGNTYEAEGDINLNLNPETGELYMVADTDTTVVYFGVKDQSGALWTICANYTFTPYTPAMPAVELPEGAEPKDNVYKYIDMTDTTKTVHTVLAQCYQDGNDVYLNLLSPDYPAWVKGTINAEGKLEVPTGQFLGTENSYLASIKTVKDYTYSFTWIDEENWLYDEQEDFSEASSATFTKVGDSWLLDEGQAIMEEYADGTCYGKYGQFEIKPYAGDVPAVPSDPTVELKDYTEYYGQWVLSSSIPSVDVNGDYIRPENMAVSLWEDGEILTLSGDDGYYLSEDVEWMPYGWMDDQGGYDLGFTSLSPYFYLYESLFTQLGMQVRYTVDGVSNYSNIVYADAEGNTETVEVDHATGEPLATGISSVHSSESTAHSYYNLAGQKVSSIFKGIVIANGKKMMK